MMTTLGGYLFTLITRIVGPSRHTWRPRSCPGLGSGSWSRRTRGGSGAVPGWAAGAGAAGHVAAPELGSGSWSRRTRGGAGATPGCVVHAEVMDTWERVICMSHILP
jgi:hypothetical protein